MAPFRFQALNIDEVANATVVILVMIDGQRHREILLDGTEKTSVGFSKAELLPPGTYTATLLLSDTAGHWEGESFVYPGDVALLGIDSPARKLVVQSDKGASIKHAAELDSVLGNSQEDAMSIQKPPSASTHTVKEHQFRNCKRVFLDFGSNIGVQIRKLYEPELYSYNWGMLSSPLIPIFDDYFGHGRHEDSDLCAIGFEMNPAHTARLKSLEELYDRCGYRTYIFTETAVSTFDGVIDFWSDNNTGDFEWGASTVYAHRHASAQSVKSVDIARFLLTEILPFAHVIVCKMDIEGAEFTVIPHLIATGVMCQFDRFLVEWHESILPTAQQAELRSLREAMPILIRPSSFCKVKVNHPNNASWGWDDEHFHRDDEYLLQNFQCCRTKECQKTS